MINYQLPKTGQVSLKIYNISGQLVKTLVNREQGAGSYSVQWDGRDESGQAVANGVYLYQIKARLRLTYATAPAGKQGSGGQAGEFSGIKKMIIIK